MEQANIKRAVQFLLIDGTASGRIQAKLDNWTGVAYRIPRLLLAESKDREDLRYCGVYFLFGFNEDSDKNFVYIGQARERKSGESLLARFAEHSRSENKNFCNEIVFFTTTTDDFGPTELCYLENRFWQLANKAKRFHLVNGNEPSVGNVTEAKQAELDRYIENAKILMNAFGYRIFETVAPNSTENHEKSIGFTLDRTTRSGIRIRAKGLWTNEGFVVLKGSELLDGNRSGQQKANRDLRSRLCATSVVERTSEGVLLLKEDQLFASPSAAGGFVVGGACNGRTAWKTYDGKTFAEIEASSET